MFNSFFQLIGCYNLKGKKKLGQANRINHSKKEVNFEEQMQLYHYVAYNNASASGGTNMFIRLVYHPLNNPVA
jgi:hypothetical protein